MGAYNKGSGPNVDFTLQEQYSQSSGANVDFELSSGGPSPDNFNNSKKLDVESVSGSPTIEKAQPVLVSDGDLGKSGNGDVEIDFSNIDGPEDISVFDESGELLDYEIESLDLTNQTGVLWVYKDWVRDGSTQAQVAFGNNDANRDNQNVTATWNNTGQNAVMVQQLNGNATDSTSNNNDGTVSGATSISTTFDGAYSFDGNGDSIDWSRDVLLDASLNEFTVAVWANWTGSTGDGEDDVLVSERTFGTGREGWWFFHNDDKSDIWGVTTNGTANSVKINFKNEMAQYVGTFDTTEIEAFIDGTSQGTQATGGQASRSAAPTRIGAKGPGNHAGEQRYWNGSVTDVRFYSDKKSASWIQADFDASPKAGQVFFSQQSSGEGVVKGVALSESSSLVDIIGINKEIPFIRESINESIQTSDNVATFKELGKIQESIAESIQPSDSVLDSTDFKRSPSALLQVGLAGTPGLKPLVRTQDLSGPEEVIIDLRKQLSETAVSADEVRTLAVLPLSENTALGASLERFIGIIRLQRLRATDADLFQLDRPLSVALAAGDNQSKSSVRALSQSVTNNDSFSFLERAAVQETQSVSDTVQKSPQLVVEELVETLDRKQVELAQSLTQAVALDDFENIEHKARRSFSESIDARDRVSKAALFNLSAVIALDDRAADEAVFNRGVVETAPLNDEKRLVVSRSVTQRFDIIDRVIETSTFIVEISQFIQMSDADVTQLNKPLQEAVKADDREERFGEFERRFTQLTDVDDDLALELARGIVQTIQVTDLTSFDMLISLAENIRLDDVLDLIRGFFRNQSESISPADSLAFTASLALVQPTEAQDSFDRGAEFFRQVSASANVADDERLSLLREFSESTELNDNEVALLEKILTQSTSVNDSERILLESVLSQGLGVADEVDTTAELLRRITQGVIATDSDIFQLGKPLAEAVPVDDNQQREAELFREFAETVVQADDSSLKLARLLLESVEPQDSETAALFRLLSATAKVNDVTSSLTRKPALESIDLTDSIPQRFIGLTPEEVIQTRREFDRTVTLFRRIVETPVARDKFSFLLEEEPLRESMQLRDETFTLLDKNLDELITSVREVRSVEPAVKTAASVEIEKLQKAITELEKN